MERTLSLVVQSGASVVADERRVSASSEPNNLAIDATTERYLASGERVRTLMDVGFKFFIVLGVLVALAWAVGLLPGAARLF